VVQTAVCSEPAPDGLNDAYFSQGHSGEPGAGNLHAGFCEGGADDAMVNLNGHEAGNGGNSQGPPTARRAFLYSDERVGKPIGHS
jgi:hypothetical protein